MSTRSSLNYTFPMPIGCVIPYFGRNVPQSFLLCDGSEYNIVDYPELNNVLAGIYGQTATTFFVPDCVNNFIQATTTNANTITPASGTASFTFTLAESNMPSLDVTGVASSLSGTINNDTMTQAGQSTKNFGGSSTEETFVKNGGAIPTPNYEIDLNGLSATYTGGAVPQSVSGASGVEPANYSVLYIIKATP